MDVVRHLMHPARGEEGEEGFKKLMGLSFICSSLVGFLQWCQNSFYRFQAKLPSPGPRRVSGLMGRKPEGRQFQLKLSRRVKCFHIISGHTV